MPSLLRYCYRLLAMSVLVGACDEPAAPRVPTPPALRVVVATAGERPDPDGYELTVDGQPMRDMRLNDTLHLDNLAVGESTVRLAGLANNCAATENEARTVSLAEDSTVTVTFEVRCAYARILFSWTVDGNTDIYAVGTDGTALKRLTTQPGRDDAPSWSPDGTRIAFARGTSMAPLYDPGRLYVMNADGSSPTPIGDSLGVTTTEWSPDGQLIAYGFREASSGCCQPQGRAEVVEVDGSGRRRIVGYFGMDGSGIRMLSFSRDGARLAVGFYCGMCGSPDAWERTETFIVATAEKTPTFLRPVLWPRFSPAADLILFRYEWVVIGKGSGYAVANTNGQVDENTPRDPVDVGGPGDWTRDGHRIVFSAGTEISWTSYPGSGRTLVLATPGGSGHVRVRP